MEKTNLKSKKMSTPTLLTEQRTKMDTKVKSDGNKTDSNKQNFQSKQVDKAIVSRVETIGPNRFQVLSFEQVKRLHRVIDKTLSIKPNMMSSLPTVKLTLRELLGEIRKKLKDQDIIVKDVRLNMDVASSVLGLEHKADFKIVDIVFTLDLNDRSTQNKIRDTIFKILLGMLRQTIDGRFVTLNESDINEGLIKDNYVRYMARANSSPDLATDSWSIISIGLQDSDGQTVELKFIDRMKRQYEFTVDSFQIILDTILAFYNVSKCSSITTNLFPTVVAESVSGSFQEAMKHLKERIIFTRQPEEIHGGGLLKYCKLLLDGYKIDTSMDKVSTEKYMSSRFFIDYPEISGQKQKVESYLNTHFYGNYEKQSKYIKMFYKIVSYSTVCLMTHERRQTLRLINSLLQNILNGIELKKSMVHLDDFNNKNWILDQVFYGTQYFPQQVYVTSPMNAEESIDINISANQILICTGESTNVIESVKDIEATSQSSTAVDSSAYVMCPTSDEEVLRCSEPLPCAS